MVIFLIIDMGYWSKVLRRLLILFTTMLGVYLVFKLSIFYIPFLIAFILSLIIEPIIKFMMKKANLKRKTSSIIVFIIVIGIIAGICTWGIATLISEISNLLEGLNGYFDKTSTLINNIINNIDFDRFKLSDDVMNVVQSSIWEFLGTISEWVKNGLTKLMSFVTSIPTIAIYSVITVLSLYFICTDKIYMLDQLEHHFPKMWVKKIGVHLRDLIKTLGGFLKAQALLIIISFVISLIGLYIFYFLGMNVKFPLIIALVIGFVDALPILGSGTAMVPWAIFSAIDGDIQLAIALMILWIIMSVIRQLLEPKIVSSQIGIHPIFTLIAMYTGFRFIGIMGMLMGPIILIILKNIFGVFIDKGIIKFIFER